MRLLPALVAAATIAVTTAVLAVPASAAVPTTCPATFAVLHNDHIGASRISEGDYTVTLLSAGRMSCAGASNRLAAFLQDFDGKLPNGWRLDPETGTFTRRGSTSYGFRIKPAATPHAVPAGGGTVYPTGRQCAGTFRVMHDDHIGTLQLPKGRYRMTLRPSGRPTCGQASRDLARFLDDPSGKLPKPWRVNAANGTFTGASGAGFRIKPVGIIT